MKGERYACESAATSREHVPPSCVFPKDSIYRKNLITVPSCNDHNGKKCRDDELLRHWLAAVPGNNDLALKVIEEGVLPAIERKPHILKTFIPNPAPAGIEGEQTVSFTLYGGRLKVRMANPLPL